MLTESKLQLYPTLLTSKLPGEHSKWSVITYEEYYSFLDVEQSLSQELVKLIEYAEAFTKQPFRFPLKIKNIQFFVGLFTESKQIFILSKQLNRELALAGLYENNDDWKQTDIAKALEQCLQLDIVHTPKSIDYLTHYYGLDSYRPSDKLELETHKLTGQLLAQVNKYHQPMFEKVSDFGLNLTANYELVRIHLLKFLAILPCLDHDKNGHEVRRILLEALRRFIEDNAIAKGKGYKGQKRALPWIYVLGAKFIHLLVNFLPASLSASLVRTSVELMAKRFIAGVDMTSAGDALKELGKTKREATIDQLGELVVSKDEADQYAQKVMDVIKGLKKVYKKGEMNAAGILKAHVSVKVTALAHDFKPYDLDYCYEQIAPRLKSILLLAKREQVFVNIDAEHYHYRDAVLDIYKRVLLTTEELKDFAQTGIVLQAYLRDGYKHLQDILKLAKSRSLLMPIRLVKGAYWDAETIEASAHNFDAPQFLNKEETDLYYRQMMEVILREGEFLQLTVAGHNIADHCYAESLRSLQYPNAPVIEHQCLHMTYEALSTGLAKMGWPTRNYIPVGNLLVGMAYLVRRIIENSSQVGVLTIMRSHKKAGKIMPPHQQLDNNQHYIYDDSVSMLNGAFRNIYPLRSYLKEELDSLMVVFQKTQQKLTNKNIKQRKVLSSDHSQKMKDIPHHSTDQVDTKIAALFKGYQESSWSEKKSYRYNALLKLADLLLLNREELTSVIMLEAGKTIDEAIADVDEAIDFIQFYTKQQLKNDQINNEQRSKGVIGVIAPWNFPLAIPVGMSVGALATGNTVLLKPAEQTSVIIAEFLKLARLAGIDSSLFDVVYGEAEIGQALSNHPLINGIVFTGSKGVGTSLFTEHHGQLAHEDYGIHPIPKTMITEMGGKNAIIVTNNSELDETVSGIIYSAFAHAGQKCSACSRVILDKNIKDAFLKRFVEASKDIVVGPATDLKTTINPLITLEDKKRVQDIVKRAVQEANDNGGIVHLDRSQEEHANHCVGPVIIELPKKVALRRESIAKQEIFGPVIHIIEYEDLDDAVQIFNSTEYALTGGIFAQSQDDIDYLIPRLEAGNLYVNRPNTGARVAIEPFGGFKMSGTGPKAGSAEYLDGFQTYFEDNINYVEDDNENKEGHTLFPNFSYLGIRHKKDLLKQVQKAVLLHWADIMWSQSEDTKAHFKGLLKYLISIKTKFNNYKYPNRLIPGQLSYDLKNMKMKRGCLITHAEYVTPKVLSHLVINIFLGNGVSLLVNNNKAHRSFEKLLSLLSECGISTKNIVLNYSNSYLTIDYLKRFHFDFYFFDTDARVYADFCQILNEKEFSLQLPKTYWSGATTLDTHPEKLIDKYVHRRSLAINTMRHGAPMVLSKEAEY
jgi:RHH-type proline utilization regulon transcriptional repressor/proline dehydrogenase/delta 1-pyrroline-5-carboxylate dehydrogenase